MISLGIVLLGAPLGLAIYSYVIYPLGLWLLCFLRGRDGRRSPPAVWPVVTLIVPCYNEERAIGETLLGLLSLDYPQERRQILVVSDASTDRTDAIATSYAARGVELLRLADRGGKTAAENAAAERIRGDLVVITDATVRIAPEALRHLVAAFEDPTVGVASGRDISVGTVAPIGDAGEAGYVGYEMWVRSLETRLGSIVGASGCFFATRRLLFATDFPAELSRDFASCLIAREHGYRSVSVTSARAFVPRAASLRTEYRRKIRTMARGLSTLWYMRRLLNPLRFGSFALKLISHKLCRWAFQLTLPLFVLGVVLMAISMPPLAPWLAIGMVGAIGVAALVWLWPVSRPLPAPISSLGYVLWANVAGCVAWLQFFQGRHQPYWEPTRRPVPPSSE